MKDVNHNVIFEFFRREINREQTNVMQVNVYETRLISGIKRKLIQHLNTKSVVLHLTELSFITIVSAI